MLRGRTPKRNPQQAQQKTRQCADQDRTGKRATRKAGWMNGSVARLRQRAEAQRETNTGSERRAIFLRNAWMHGTCALTIPTPPPPHPPQLVRKIACVKIDNPSTAARRAVHFARYCLLHLAARVLTLNRLKTSWVRLRGGWRAQSRVHPSIYIYIHMHPIKPHWGCAFKQRPKEIGYFYVSKVCNFPQPQLGVW